jgi:hypothetical protein
VTTQDWLLRLDAEAWLAAAEGELARSQRTVAMRRTAVTHARRAAGMAINAVLRRAHELGAPDAHVRLGRSYMEHVARLADGAAAAPWGPAAVAAAAVLVRTSPSAPELVHLGGAPHAEARAAAAAAAVLVQAARDGLAASAPHPPGGEAARHRP